MTENRKNSLKTIQSNCNVNFTLVTNENLHEFIDPHYPIHPGYIFLSDVHKADYLRTYFMHVHGGGYTDIKPCNWDWNPYFEQLNSDSKAFGIGAPEDEFELSVTPKQRPWLGKHWDKLMTNDLYIFKRQTEFTEKWYSTLLKVMDEKFPILKKYPAKYSREAADTFVTRYPIQWGEILLEIFHPLCFAYTDRLIKTMPLPVTVNYR